MNRRERTTLLSAAIAVALLLGACGFGSPHAQAAQSPAALWHVAAQCVRDHGQPDFPDPTLDSHNQPQLPSLLQVPHRRTQSSLSFHGCSCSSLAA